MIDNFHPCACSIRYFAATEYEIIGLACEQKNFLGLSRIELAIE